MAKAAKQRALPSPEGTPVTAVVVAQPLELFDEASLPVREDLVEMVHARSFLPEKRPDSARFSGKITIRRMMSNEELCEQVCTCIAVGLSPRLIGKRFSMSPRSVVRIREAMEDRGELAPVGKRIRAQLDRFIELGLERMVDGVLDGEIHPGQLPIAVLAAIDKKGQLDAGVVPGTSVLVGEAEGAQIKAYFEALRQAKAAATESQSIVPSAQGVELQVQASDVTPLDTPLDTLSHSAQGLEAVALVTGAPLAEPALAPAQAREEAGGGIDSAPPAAQADALVQNSADPKEPLSS